MYETVVKNPIHLVHCDDGIVHTFKDYNEVVRYWPWIKSLGGFVGIAHKVTYSPEDGFAWPARYYTYALRDSYGNSVDPHDVACDYRARYVRGRWRQPNRLPGRKYSNGHWFRRPRTTQEKRWAHAWEDEEFAPKVRGRRSLCNLPDAWDDFRRSDLESRNWKRYRKYQWKNK